MEYKGVGVSNGKSIGAAVVLKEIKVATKKENIDANRELEKISSSFSGLVGEYDAIINDIRKSKEIVALAEAYKMMISSPSLYNEIKNLIIGKNYDAVSSVAEVLDDKANKMLLLDTEYSKERALDIRSIKMRIINKIQGIDDIDISKIDYDFILIGKEITPSMLLEANPKFIKGLVSEIGSKTSHIAILAKSIGIPAIFNIKDIDKILIDGEAIYIDGNKGIIVSNLNNNDINNFREEVKKHLEMNSVLEEMKYKKCKTIDEKSFEVASNAGDINDLDRVINVNPDGIGLFRSEFLYLNRDNPPSEELQFNTYKAFAISLKNKPLIIRTIDIGGDKKSSFIDIPKEDNPFLGYRAIRYCLDHKELFKAQLRAILRASNYGNIMIMYPMISNLEEIRKANVILREAMSELTEDGIPYDEDIKVGIMIEVPSAAIMSDLMIDEVDFFSIGTNDLIQYTMAVDRTNSSVMKLYDAYNPAVIRLLKKVIESKKEGKFIGMCGEMAADPIYIILLVGLGLDEFSVNVNSVFKVKKYISLLNYEECKKIVDHILTFKTGEKIKSYLDNYAKEIYGTYLDL